MLGFEGLGFRVLGLQGVYGLGTRREAPPEALGFGAPSYIQATRPLRPIGEVEVPGSFFQRGVWGTPRGIECSEGIAGSPFYEIV